MKYIVVEGHTDAKILIALYPELQQNDIVIRVAMGFSNVLSASKALIDCGNEVLIMVDSDSHQNPQQSEIMKKLFSSNFKGRHYTIVWMEPFIERVIEQAVPGFYEARRRNANNIKTLILQNSQAIRNIGKFQEIEKFIMA